MHATINRTEPDLVITQDDLEVVIDNIKKGNPYQAHDPRHKAWNDCAEKINQEAQEKF